MKISNASKKVLASALSAAMVVAFAPTVAFGAQGGANHKITVEYDLAGGYDSATDTQTQVKNAEYTVADTVVAAEKYAAEEAAKHNAALDGNVKAGDIKKNLADFDDIYDSVASAEEALNLKDQGVAVYYAADKSSIELDAATNAQIAGGTNLYKVKDSAKYDQAGADVYNATLPGAVKEGDVKKAGSSYASIQLASGDKVNLADEPSTEVVEGYKFDHWAISYDKNGDGVIDAADGDFTEAAPANGLLDVSDAKYKNGMTVKAKAVYKAATLATAAATVDQAAGKLKFSATASISADKKVIGTPKFVVTAPSGAAVEKATLSNEAVAAEVGTWTVELKDGNGVTLDTQKVYVGSITLTNGAYKDWGWSKDALTQKYNTTQTAWYVAGDTASDAKAVLDNVDSGREHTSAYKLDKDGKVTVETASAYYTAEGKKAKEVVIEAGAKGAVATTLVAAYASDEAAIQNFSFDKKANKLTAIIAGSITSANFVSTAAVKNVTVTDEDGFYLAVTDAEGKIVAETADTDGKDNQFAANGKTLSVSNPAAGSYTATLYKVTSKNSTVGDETPGKMEVVSTATAEVADIYAAAPTWSYTAKYKADGTVDGGALTLTNNAGDGFKLFYGNSGSASVEYDTTKGALTVSAADFNTQKSYLVVSKAKDAKAEVQTSKTVELFNYKAAKDAFDTAAKNFNTKTVNGKVGSYYASNQAVKDAVKAADKTFTDKGFAEKTATANDAAKAWKPVTVAAEQSVVDAVAGVAKAELAKYAAGLASADGKKTTILTAEGYAAAVKAVDAVSAAYAANHDGDTANNVAKVNGVSLTNLASYVDAADKAVEDAVKAAKSLDSATVASAKAVNDAIAALPAEVTAANAKDAKAAAEKVVADFAALNADAKSLVSSTDYAKAVETIEAADAAIKAADKAAIAKVKGKTVKAKAKKATKSSLKVVTSKSGAKSTFKKTSGNKKVTVSKSGKIVVKKGLKAGKKYTVKVKATVGTQTKTVKVVVKVAK